MGVGWELCEHLCWGGVVKGGLPMPTPRSTWGGFLFNLHGSVIPAIWPKVLVSGGFAFGVSLVDRFVRDVAWPVETSIVPSLVLGLLLVFRTNTAYERFWEGRKQWGQLVIASRNLVRLMAVAIAERDVGGVQRKREAMRWVAAFGYGLKQHLREEAIDPQMLGLVLPQLAVRLRRSHSVPLELLFELGGYFQGCYRRQLVSMYQLSDLHRLLDILSEVVGSCERILKTPVPLAYSIHLRQLLYAYCLTIPFVFVDEFGLWTPVVVGLVAFTVFGIEEIGLEIENPFGHDPNDLPLDGICGGVREYVESVVDRCGVGEEKRLEL